MKRIMKGMSLLLAAALMLGVGPASQADAAAKKMKLSKKKLTLRVGQSRKLKVKNKKGKVKWKSSKKKVAKVSKKGVVKAKKTGKATIKAIVTYKKKKTTLKCKVTVKAKKKAASTPALTQKKNTPKPTTKPGSGTGQSTPPGQAPTPTPRKESTITEDEMKKATSGDFMLHRVDFESQELTYQLSGNVVYVTVDDNKKLKDVLSESDISKLGATVRFINDEEMNYGVDKVDDVKIANIEWHETEDEYWYGDLPVNGYYSCKVYAKVKTKVYFRNACIGGYSGDYGVASDRISITGVEYNGKMLDGEGDGFLFNVNTEENQSIKDLIPDPSQTKIHFSYLQEDYTVEPAEMQWHEGTWYENAEGREPKDEGYYSFSISTRDGNLLIKGSDLELVEYFPYVYVLYGYDPKMDVEIWPDTMGRTIAYSFFDSCGKETLKELFNDDLSKLQFTCMYRSKEYEDAVISNVVWHEEPYYENGYDSGYYTFTLTVTTQGGKKVAEEFDLVEPSSSVRKHMVTGKITTEDNTPLANMNFVFAYDGDDDIGSVVVKTDANGEYRVKIASAHYTIRSADTYDEVAEIDVTDETTTLNIRLENLYLLKGTLKRGTQIWSNTSVTLRNDDWQMYYFTSDAAGEFCALIPAGTYSLSVNSYESGQSVTVDRSNLNWELTFNVFVVSGSVTRTNGEKMKHRGFSVQKADGEEYVETLFTDEDGNYSVYLEPGEYSVIDDGAWAMKIGTITITDRDITKEFSVPLAKITVNATRFGVPYDDFDLMCMEKTGNEMNPGMSMGLNSIENGQYEIYVPFDKTYMIRTMDNFYEKEVSVQQADQELSIAIDRYHIAGKVIRTDADNAPIVNMSLILVKGSEKIPLYVSDDGSYSALLGVGTWQLVFGDADNGLKLGEIAVTGDNDNQNINVTGVVRISGTVTYDGEPFSWNFISYSYTKDSLQVELSASTGDFGRYTIYVPAGVNSVRINVMDQTCDCIIPAGVLDHEFDVSASME